MPAVGREKINGSGEWRIFVNHQGRRRTRKIGTKKAANTLKREDNQLAC